MRRRSFFCLPAALTLAACGFELRKAPEFAFQSIAVSATSAVATELRRNLVSAGTVRVLPVGAKLEEAQVILDILSEGREKVVVSMNSSGEVREFQLRSRLHFRLRTPQGKELISDTELLQQREVSFNESAVLAKESEEGLLYRDMQTDLVQQLMRRIAAVKTL
jgi:LPS-assembly lipoprotein